MSHSSKYYYINVSGEGVLSMAEEALEQLCELMPTLRFLLLGHPNMQPKQLQKAIDGASILELPVGLGVSKKAFLYLVNCVFGVAPLPLPSRTRDRAELQLLLETMTTLGGCESLQSRLQEANGANPMTPEEDVHERFTWHIGRQSQFDTIDDEDIRKSASAGFSHTMSIRDDDTGTYMTILYRKQK